LSSQIVSANVAAVIPAANLYFIRHAEVDARYHRVFGGRIDMDLSPRGQEQAAILGTYLQRQHFDAVYVSPMKRAQQTLACVTKDRDCAPIILPGLAEIDFGDWTGLGWDEVRTRFGVNIFEWLDHLERGAIAGAETVTGFRGRVEPELRRILRDHPGQNVAVVCHGGTIRMLLSILLELPMGRMSMFDIEYTSVTRVHYSPGRVEIQLLNFTPWRDIP